MLQKSSPAFHSSSEIAVILERRSKPRLFFLEYARKRTRGTQKDVQEAWGTCYSDGFVTLDEGQLFSSLADMERFLTEQGTYVIHWLGEDGQVCSEEATPR